MAWLHHIQIAHLDLKPSNILVLSITFHLLFELKFFSILKFSPTNSVRFELSVQSSWFWFGSIEIRRWIHSRYGLFVVSSYVIKHLCFDLRCMWWHAIVFGAWSVNERRFHWQSRCVQVTLINFICILKQIKILKISKKKKKKKKKKKRQLRAHIRVYFDRQRTVSGIQRVGLVLQCGGERRRASAAAKAYAKEFSAFDSVLLGIWSWWTVCDCCCIFGECFVIDRFLFFFFVEKDLRLLKYYRFLNWCCLARLWKIRTVDNCGKHSSFKRKLTTIAP